MNNKNLILFVVVSIFLVVSISAASITDDLHLNIQTTDSSGTVQTGTFDFVFNISTTSDCSSVVYTNETQLTTDNRGIISYYLPNVTLDYDVQYWLCYYRYNTDGSLNKSDISKLARTPYTFTAKNISASGVKNDSNLDLTGKNVSASYFIGNGSQLSGIETDVSDVWVNESGDTMTGSLNLSDNNITDVNYGFFSWLGSLTNRITKLFVQDVNASGNITTSGRVGIGTISPSVKLHVIGDTNVTGTLYVDILDAGTILGEYTGTISAGNVSSGEFGSETGGGDYTFDNNTLHIDSTNHRVGIGTSSPQKELHIETGTNDSGIRLTSTGGGGIELYTSDVSASNPTWTMHTFADENLLFNHGSTESLYLEGSTGNVGIGTSSPSSLLTTGKSSGKNEVNLSGVFYVNSTSGRVGIGTASADSLLHIKGILKTSLSGVVNTSAGSDVVNTSQDLTSEISANDAIKISNETISEIFTVSAITSSNITLDSAASYSWTDANAYKDNTFFNIDDGDGTRKVTVDNSGFVGIGTSNPTQKLDVGGKIRIGSDSSAASTGVIRWTGSDFEGYNGTAWASLTGAGSGGSVWSTSGNNIYYNDGSVGIGDATPTSLLEIKGDGSAFNIQNSTGTSKFFVNSTSGNVGIGTTGPNAKLAIGNNVGDGFDAWSDYQLLLYTGSTPQESYGLGIKSGTLAFNTNNDFDFDQDGSTVMTIDDGNVGIGTSSPSSKLEVDGNIQADNVADISIIASNNAQASDDEEETTSSTSYVTVYTAQIDFSGTTKVYLEHKSPSGGVVYSEVRVLKNGNEEAVWSTNERYDYVPRSVDVDVKAGDIIKIEHRQTYGSTYEVYIRNKRIQFDIENIDVFADTWRRSKWSGSFTNGDGNTVIVEDGIIADVA